MRFPGLDNPDQRTALTFPEHTLSYPELAGAVAAVRATIAGAGRVAVWATPVAETVVAVLGALTAGVTVVPVNPKLGDRERGHVLGDSAPELLLAAPGTTLPDDVSAPVHHVDVHATADTAVAGGLAAEAPAFVVYTSGTTGPPKGVVQPRRAITSNVDSLAEAWGWGADTVVHGLPLFHVHGLILGCVGPLLRGGAVHHLGKFDAHAAGAALADTALADTAPAETGAGMLFGVPTMYGRLADAVEADAALARQIGAARLLVSGSAPLPASVHQRITAATGQRIVERYGMTETLMNTSVRADGERRPGTVGPPLSTVELRLTEESTGAVLDVADDSTVGEIEVRGPNLFTEYLNRPDATAEAFRDGWFRTGDVATRAADGYIRIVGRSSTDLIKSGGYKIGAGEIENALLEHDGVAEAAVTGEPDEDLGERVVAWIVLTDGAQPSEKDLADHVANLLTPHKRPRTVRFVDSLPRNDMGKVQKKKLTP